MDRTKDLLGLRGLAASDLERWFSRTDEAAAEPVLRGRTVALLFYEPSTRTRASFELAARRLGADVVTLDVPTSSVTKGESLLDTARNLVAMGVDAIVIRHPHGGAPHFLAERLPCSVVNAGDGANEHPTQGLLDLYTLRQRLGSLSGRRVAIIGDVLHSRVARSDLWGLTALGVEVVLAGPATLMPTSWPWPARYVARIEDAVAGADAVCLLRLQKERQKAGLVPSLASYSRDWGMDARRLQLAQPAVPVLHPGPINRGVEIQPDVADGPQSLILTQVRNGVRVRMAVLATLLGGGDRRAPAFAAAGWPGPQS